MADLKTMALFIVGVLFGLLGAFLPGFAIISVIALGILYAWHMGLVGRLESKARELFDEWRGRELEKQASERASVLFEQWKSQFEEQIRRDAIERSKAVTLGKVTEHLAPYMPQFPYNPKDARFIGSPVDLIVFDGLSDEGGLRRVVFVEIKAGKGALSPRERHVRNVIQQKRVEWEEFNIV